MGRQRLKEGMDRGGRKERAGGGERPQVVHLKNDVQKDGGEGLRG